MIINDTAVVVNIEAISKRIGSNQAILPIFLESFWYFWNSSNIFRQPKHSISWRSKKVFYKALPNKAFLKNVIKEEKMEQILHSLSLREELQGKSISWFIKKKHAKWSIKSHWWYQTAAICELSLYSLKWGILSWSENRFIENWSRK